MGVRARLDPDTAARAVQLGFTVAGTINSEWSRYPANLWWPWAILGALIVLAAGFYGIRTSARMGTILGVSEIAVFLVLAVFFVVHAGRANTLSVFATGYTPSGYKGITGVIAGSVYTVLAFGGFEGAAPLAEESGTRGAPSRGRSGLVRCVPGERTHAARTATTESALGSFSLRNTRRAA